ncbi:MAG: hypothetical protein ACLFWG_08240, partial [Longimicrobiales bacterium]
DFPLRGRFSRAEQTRRALSQDPRDHYVPAELEAGGKPEQARGAPRGRPELSGYQESGAAESGSGESGAEEPVPGESGDDDSEREG